MDSGVIRGKIASLRGADLRGAILRGAILPGADLHSAVMHQCILGGVDLSLVRSLETVIHAGPSTVGTDTLAQSEGGIPDSFLRGCGLAEWEVLQAKLYDPALTASEITGLQYQVFDKRARGPIFLGGVFISYSHADAKAVLIEDENYTVEWFDFQGKRRRTSVQNSMSAYTPVPPCESGKDGDSCHHHPDSLGLHICALQNQTAATLPPRRSFEPPSTTRDVEERCRLRIRNMGMRLVHFSTCRHLSSNHSKGCASHSTRLATRSATLIQKVGLARR